jgi:deoxyribonuclease IV
MESLVFGTAGIPLSTEERETNNGIREVKTLGLGAMELEFVHSVNISKEKAPMVKKTAADNGVVLTCHGQYYINLNSQEKAKMEASKKRIINAATVANMCGAFSMVFHAGFYMKQDASKVYSIIKKELKEVVNHLKDNGVGIWVRPETTGKGTQFGNLKELLTLSSELDQVMPCIDFSHLHARSNGKYNTLEEFRSVLSDVEKVLGRKGLDNMHIHLSGIEYGEKGEKKHLELNKSDMNYKDLLKAFHEFKVKGVLICESPIIEKDALLLQKTYKK